MYRSYAHGFLLSLMLCVFADVAAHPQQHLFPAVQHGKTGFIDSTGHFVIPPRFQSAHDFSEGLAAVMVDGRYGFINERGRFVVEPRYDFATSFSEGLAVVFQDGWPSFINSSGTEAFRNYFRYVGPFVNGAAKVYTGAHYGYIDKTGTLIIDTVYTNIQPFVDGHALMNDSKLAMMISNGVINRSGKVVVPTGKYRDICILDDGHFLVCSPPANEDDLRHYSCIDTLGNTVFSIPDSEPCQGIDRFSCGLAKVELKSRSAAGSSDRGQRYIGFINLRGKVVLRLRDFKYATGFSHNCAFVWGDARRYSLIDTKGDFLAHDAYSGIMGLWPDIRREFWTSNGLAFAEVNDKWGVIDTNGSFVLKPVYDAVHGWALENELIFFERKVSDKNVKEDFYLIGIADLKGQELFPATIEQVDRRGFQRGLLSCVINQKKTYLNRKGEIVWQEQADRQLRNMDIDYRNSAEYYAEPKGDRYDRSSSSLSKNIRSRSGFPDGKLSVNVRQEERDTYRNIFNGYRVYIANTTGRTVFFPSDEGRLDLNLQALDERGIWRDIEYIPHSGCGNSFHTVSLNSDNYWSFVMPVYTGGFKTKLRVALKYLPEATHDVDLLYLFDSGNVETIYSESYDGSINPAQCWRDRYFRYPRGLDPTPSYIWR